MEERPYRRSTMQLSKPLLAAVVCGALAALVWAVGMAADVDNISALCDDGCS